LIRAEKGGIKEMDGIFNLPYSEFEVINVIQRFLKKSDGYSAYVPVSRQQKGIDFIVHNSNTNKILRFQVKSSRTYIHEAKELKKGKIKPPKYKYNLWLNNFIDKYEKGHCDYYILFGLYPVYSTEINIKDEFWKSILLCYDEKEMIEILEKIKTKKENKTDRFFSYGFNSGNEIFNERGLKEDINATDHLLKNKITKIKLDLER
jgi:hypothetical protein